MDGADFKNEVENIVNCYDVASLLPRERCRHYVMTYSAYLFIGTRNGKSITYLIYLPIFITLAPLLFEIFPFEIWILYICNNGPNCNGVMVTAIYPTLPPICCHFDMFEHKNCLFLFLNNIRRLRAVICCVKLYYSLILL